MKKRLRILTGMVIGLGLAFGLGIESALAEEPVSTLDYIVSENGFVVKTGYYDRVNGYRVYSSGLYTRDGKTLVKAIWAVDDETGYVQGSESEYHVIYGTETIASHAFSNYSSKTVCVTIPSTVKYIASDAFDGDVHVKGIFDRCTEATGSTTVNRREPDPNAKETSRYNLDGMEIDTPQQGINIVHKSDGTSMKELVK